MQEADLSKLTVLVEKMLRNRKVLNIVDGLKAQLVESNEPFVCATYPSALSVQNFQQAFDPHGFLYLDLVTTRLPITTPTALNTRLSERVMDGQKSAINKLSFKFSTPMISSRYGTSLEKASHTNL